MKDESFKDFVLDQLSALSSVEARRMFGGFGLYSEKMFFGIIPGGVLYFKTNENTRGKYAAAGSRPFAPSKKQVLKNYCEVPADVLEDSQRLCEWAEEAARIS